MELVVVVPGLRVTSLNVREHWSARARRCKAQKEAAFAALVLGGAAARRAFGAAPVVRVRLVRVGGRKLDRDNLAGAFKPVLDAVSQWVGIDDGDEGRLPVEWAQEPGGAAGVRIELVSGA